MELGRDKKTEMDLFVFRDPIKAFFDSRIDAKTPLPAGLQVLVVDDEPFVCDAIKTMLTFDGQNVQTANTGKEALNLCQQKAFDVVITDFAMPGMKGNELGCTLKTRNPNQPVIMITAYAEMLQSTGKPLFGIDFVVSKPFGLEHLRQAFAHVLPRPLKVGDEEWMAVFKSQGCLLMLNETANAYRAIVDLMRSPSDLAQIMIRHKAKNLLITYLDSLQTENELCEKTNKLGQQFVTLTRFCERVRSTENQPFAQYLGQVVEDFSKEHDAIKLECELTPLLDKVEWNSNTVALLSLIVCELMDNAAESLKGRGEIQLRVAILLTKRSLFIKVKDNGPGVSKDAVDKIFRQSFSSRGPGRGLGLHLIKEGSLKLGGNVEYTFEDGAAFKVSIPIPADEAWSRLVSYANSLRNTGAENRRSRPVQVVVSYSHRDEALRRRLDANLKLLQNQGLISIWNDRKIMPGDVWESVIEEEFQNADIILLLVSADFLASDYCQNMEVRIALRKHSHAESSLIPVIVRACDWKEAVFGKFQALPKDGKPITSWANRDEAWSDVAVGIRKAVVELRRNAS